MVLSLLSSVIQPATSVFLLLFLLLLSAIVFASRFVNRRMGLQVRGRIIMVLAIALFLFVFFAPAVQTMPSGGGTGSVCKGAACSNVAQWASATDYRYCIGTKYQFDTIDGLMIVVGTGCLPPFMKLR